MGNFDGRKSVKMEHTTWLSIIIAVITIATPALASTPRVVCYYTNWSVYRPGTAKFNPQNINPYLCTHLVYAFGGFTKDNTLKPFDKYQDIEKGGYAKFTGLKTYNKNLKTMLAIGGWNEGSTRFSPMVAAKDRRKEFVRNAIKFLRQNHFDGLDLDWEYPAFRDGGKPKDRENYAKLVKELREEFERESEKTGKPRLLLTMAVPAGIEYIEKGFDVKTLNRYLDWMNLLTYDYHSAFEPAVNHHAPLFPLEEPNEYSVDNELNIDYTIKFYLENGADPDKLVLGIPTYGRSYTLFNPDAVEIGSPADGPGEQGDATREKGYLAYYEICEALKPKNKKRAIASDEYSEEEDEDSEEEPEEEWTITYPNKNAMGPVAFKGNQWVGYDDVDIVKRKAEYVAVNGLGGIMFWSIDNDDFRGTCHGKPYPLIEAAKETYIANLGSSNRAVVKETPKKSGSSGRRRNRPRSSSTTTTTTTTTTTQKPRPKSNKRKSSTTISTTPSWNIITPEPPTTPDPGSDFKCKDEGFFPHPRDCKKYFWCLDSGPSDLGIVAHQFTCPSGLYFNKAADSCDFARNVLCKKPTETTKAPTKPTTAKTTTPTTTTTTTTTRRPIRLTSRSSLLFRTPPSTTTTTTTTTTPEPELSEEEESAEEEISDVEAEDPKVIKELIDLIKKVGGVEQLEKHLKISETPSSSGTTDGIATTTPSAFNKKLYQKVLERARGKNKFPTSSVTESKLNSNSITESSVQNSRRRPQNEGLEPTPDKNRLLRKDRPQYVTINRSRPTPSSTTPLTSESEEIVSEEESEEVPVSRAREVPREETFSVATTPRPLQYVNIRRSRPTTAGTEAPDESRNALFERDPFVAVESPNALDIANARRESVPEYVTLRRSRPSAETSTIQYRVSEEVEEEDKESQETALEREITSQSNQPQYSSVIRTRSTTLPPEPNTPEPTTILAVQISSLLNAPSSDEKPEDVEPIVQTTEPETTTTTTTITTTTSPVPTTTTTTTPTTTTAQTTRRSLLRRRGSTLITTTEATTTTTQVSSRNYSFIRRRRPLSQPNEISESNESVENLRKIRSTTPDSREVDSIKIDGDSGVINRFQSRFRISSSGDTVPAAASQVSRGQIRPQLSRDEVLSLTPIDIETSEIVESDEDIVKSNTFRGRLPSTVSDRAQDSDVSAATIDERRPNTLNRGRGRFSTFTTVAVDKSTESNESPVTQKRPTLTRFTPRPFTRTASTPNITNSVSESTTQKNRPRLQFGRPRNTVTAAPILQARKLPFVPRRITTQQPVNLEDDDEELDNRNDDINLSESAIAEKEHDEEEENQKKSNPSEEIIEDIPTGESDKSGKRKFRVIRRRPTTTTSEIPTPEILETTTVAVTRIRKIIRKKLKTADEEPEISSKSVGLINAGFKDIPKEVINYGEKTRTTTPLSLIEEYRTTTENDEEIEHVTEILKETTPRIYQQKPKEVTQSNIDVTEANQRDKNKDEESNNLEKFVEEIEKPKVTVENEEKEIDFSSKDLETNKAEQNATVQKDNSEVSKKIEDVEVSNENKETSGEPHVVKNETSIENQATENESDENTSTEPTATETEILTETTVPSTTKLTSPSPRSRSPYKPAKRLFTSTTESTPSSSRTYSRKYNPGVYTSPSTVDRPGTFTRGTTRRPLFSRTFTRRTFPTIRTTPKLQDEEEEEYSEEEILEEEPESPFAFVPPNRLFTRKPDSEEYEEIDEEEEVGNEDLETPEEEDYEDEQPERYQPTQPTSKKPQFKPRVINSNTFRTSTSTTEIPKRIFGSNQNKTVIYNRFGGNKPVIDNKKRVQNVPIGYSTPKQSQNNSSINATKAVPTTKSDKIETTTIPTILNNAEQTTTESDDYLSMPEVTTIKSETSTNIIEFETKTAEMEIDNSTDDYLEFTENYPSTNDFSTVNLQTDVVTETSADQSVTKIPENIAEITTETSGEPETTTTTAVTPIVKTQFDKLFSISRVVEVSSKLDKHRINKNNETTLIEEGQVKVEKKPTVDKIGEVSRFSLIKIVEDEIPIYLTKYGHIYPVDNPPDNPIRIDEARNARALVDYFDVPKENLVASESMNEAYRHVNRVSAQEKLSQDKGQVEHIINDDFLSYVNDDKKTENSNEGDSYPHWQFVPAAYENEKSQQGKAAKTFDVVTPRLLTDPSTLPLEALFKTENPMPRKVSENIDNKPFVVYSAPVPTQEDEASLVKLKILIPQTARNIVTFAKGKEFKGPTIEESTVKYPISISILEQSPKLTKSTTPSTSTTVIGETLNTIISTTTSTESPRATTSTENIKTSPILELLTTLSPTTANNDTIQTTEPLPTETTTDSSTTESVPEETTTGKISPLDIKRAKYGLPRRPANLNRYGAVPRNVSKVTITPKPIQRVNKTTNFSPSKSRFSANRAQNVPVDVRKKLTTRLGRTYTTEPPRSTTERKVVIKPRPVRPSFVPRRLTTTPRTEGDT